MSIAEFFLLSSHVSAYLAALATGIVGYGFVRLSFRYSGLVGHLATGLLLMHTAVFLRTMYWDALGNLLPARSWKQWYAFSGETSVNLLFNVMVIVAGYHSLKALRLAIPEEVRGQYGLIGAAFYPRPRLLRTLGAALVARVRRRR